MHEIIKRTSKFSTLQYSESFSSLHHGFQAVGNLVLNLLALTTKKEKGDSNMILSFHILEVLTVSQSYKTLVILLTKFSENQVSIRFTAKLGKSMVFESQRVQT